LSARHPPGVVSDAALIGLIGAGRMAAGIARALSQAGRSVCICDRVPARALALAGGQVRAGSVEDALQAPIVILALRFPAPVEFARAHARELAGRVVVDIATPLDDSYEHLVLPPTTSGAEELARAIPHARVVKAFNTNLAVTLSAGGIDGEELDTFVASDDAEAKRMVIEALAGTGLRALDAGALANSRVLEAMAAFGIELGDRYGLGESQEFGFKYLPRRLDPADARQLGSTSPADTR
jgi:8-hydroxy-5-deazaflavin:NADPH oxidoreductase